ncbi:hypothetical protein ADK59_21715 [Streptomyces sp. XY332]|nr:hypothetical protein ADK59_21715 [Streptomyces sp. XY332]
MDEVAVHPDEVVRVVRPQVLVTYAPRPAPGSARGLLRLRGGSECHRDSFAWWLRQGFPAYHHTAGQSRREFPARYSPRGTTSARRELAAPLDGVHDLRLTLNGGFRLAAFGFTVSGGTD